MAKKKSVLGYGFKLKNESISKALACYKDGFCKNKKEVEEDIGRGKTSQDIPQHARPKIFRVVVEEV